MIARPTLYFLLLSLLCGSVLLVYRAQHADPCDHLPADQTVIAQTGTRNLYIPCGAWAIRQSLPVQGLELAAFALGGLFCVSLISDIARTRADRARIQQQRL